MAFKRIYFVAYLLALFTFISTGCSKEYNTDYKGVLKNPTRHSIKILPFVYGFVNPNDTILLQTGDSFIIAQGTFRGDVTSPAFVSYKFDGPVDSSYIIYDDSFIVVQYTNVIPDSFSKNYYLYDNPRNIWNSKNYEFSRIKLSKHHYLNYHQFIFTEEDYDFAKN